MIEIHSLRQSNALKEIRSEQSNWYLCNTQVFGDEKRSSGMSNCINNTHVFLTEVCSSLSK